MKEEQSAIAEVAESEAAGRATLSMYRGWWWGGGLTFINLCYLFLNPCLKVAETSQSQSPIYFALQNIVWNLNNSIKSKSVFLVNPHLEITLFIRF